MKVFSVFNAAQLEGYEAIEKQGKGEIFNNSKADQFVANTKAEIRSNEKSAYYCD